MAAKYAEKGKEVNDPRNIKIKANVNKKILTSCVRSIINLEYRKKRFFQKQLHELDSLTKKISL